MSQTATEKKHTTVHVPQWFDKWVQESGLPFLADIHRTGKVLGRGQSSVVEDVVYSGEVCAMKEPFFSYDNHVLLKEAKMLAELQHPHVLKLIGITAIGDDVRVALVLERGATTLRQFLSSYQKETIPLQLKLQILQQVSEAVQHLHTQEPPIVHGDISGTNIYLTDQYQVKLGDFGSAHTERQVPQISSVPYLKTSVAILPQYTKYETSFDIFAIAVLIIEMLSHPQTIPMEYVAIKTSVKYYYAEFLCRQRYIDQYSAEKKEHFVPPIKQRLTASEDDRPQVSGLVRGIQQIRATLGISDNLMTYQRDGETGDVAQRSSPE